ncbi:MAG: cytochrome c biogenesis protein CcsA [Alistipes sp.]|nr:cytochrome c biogenesis protein CcsA [Alistipes senegalensis]MCM1250468.1 cytochrome c biogenesis protein CcsA [Alistipes sp.]
MACCTLGLTLLLRRRFALLRPFGCLIAGLALAVSTMGESNPQITPLMPVLASPLLCIHVMLVMAAYSLLAFLFFNGLTGTALSLAHRCEEAGRLAVMGRLMLCPAVFLLAAGIFVGAVWANVSWGRYWGWDPKEVWALVTLLAYAAALHTESLPRFRQPLFFHAFCAAAFLTVLITYFGVNFLLGGMHAYAG